MSSAQNGIAGYHFRILDLKKTEVEFEKLKTSAIPPIDKARKLLDLIYGSYLHTNEKYTIKPWDNWLLWFWAFLNERHLESQDGDFLWKRGGGFCHQAATIYAAKGAELGFETRIVWLNGHVISQILIPDLGWRAVDVDLGIFWNYSVHDFKSMLSENKIVSVINERGFDRERAKKIAQKYLTLSDNRISYYPYLPKLYQSEKSSTLPKQLIPVLLILVAGLVLKAAKSDFSRN